jgi:hypothetical protein
MDLDKRGIKEPVMLLLAAIAVVVACGLVLHHRGDFEGINETGTGKADISASGSSKDVYMVFVEVEDKILYLIKNGKCIKEYTVSTGRWGMPSPLGCWRIIQKDNWGDGFGGYWMGFNVPWGKYGIHGTQDPGSIGWASSEGCIRMNNHDVKELYEILPYNTEVVIVNGSFGAFGSGFAKIEQGNIGSDVLEIQRRLKQLEYYTGPLDGIFEDGMKAALNKFQKDHNLPVVNVVTRQAWLAMGFKEFE